MAEAADEHGDEPFDDEPHRGAPPDPLDRVWLHPSELATLAPKRPARSRPTVALRAGTHAAAGAVGALVVVGVLAAIGAFDDGSATKVPAPEAQVAQSDAAAVRLAMEVAPSVVAVVVAGPSGQARGSGVSVRHTGEVLTSATLVGDATEVTVTTADGTTATARVLGVDESSDLALVDVEGDLPAARLAERPLAVGDTVWVFGAASPGGTLPWMARGLVNATDALVASPSGPAMAGLLETTGMNAPGGGAVVDRTGAVAGIVMAQQPDDYSSYALPISLALSIAQELRTDGVARHGNLGLVGVDATEGPTVSSVAAGGPAARAGIETGDVVLAVGDRPVLTMAEITAAIRAYAPGETLTLELRRADKLLEVDVKLGSTSPDATSTTVAHLA